MCPRVSLRVGHDLLLQILWAGIVCLLDAALLQCTLSGDELARREVLKYFKEKVLPTRLHYIVELLPHHGAQHPLVRCLLNVCDTLIYYIRLHG
jgi:hypothetical protein